MIRIWAIRIGLSNIEAWGPSFYEWVMRDDWDDNLPASVKAGLTPGELAELRREVAVSRTPVVRGALIAVGVVSTALGIVGIVLPLLPTTPFLLLAAACFARSSTRFYVRLLTAPYLGSYIRDWRAGRGVPRRVKIVAITTLWLTLGPSVYFFVPVLGVQVFLICVGLLVTLHIARLPTRVPEGPDVSERE